MIAVKTSKWAVIRRKCQRRLQNKTPAVVKEQIDTSLFTNTQAFTSVTKPVVCNTKTSLLLVCKSASFCKSRTICVRRYICRTMAGVLRDTHLTTHHLEVTYVLNIIDLCPYRNRVYLWEQLLDQE